MRRRLAGIALATAAAVVSGLLLFLSFPPRATWWLAPAAFALLGAVVNGRRAREGFGLGYLAGLGFFLPLLVWTGEFVGALPWLALVALEAVFVALAAAGIAVVSRLPAAPVWMAVVWVAGEAVRARVPFGGFPWGKVAFGQAEGVFLPLASLGGTPVVAFAVALSGFALTSLVRRARERSPRRAGLVAAVAMVALPPLAGLAAMPLVSSGPETGTATAAVIQGNVPRLGLDFNAQRRAVLDNHVARTEELAADVAVGRVARPDFVIWPENSSDIDPFRNPDAAAVIDRAVRTIGAPVLVGAVESPPSGGRNTAIRWEPGQGPTGSYVKRQLQPFGETMPLRSVVRLFSEDVDRVPRDFVAGSEPGVLRMGPALVGVATCYEAAFDWAVRDSVRAGASVLAVPSNNATFGRTDMTYQQLAMSRVRAVEHGRAVLVAATSGVSAVILPDGTVVDQTELFTPDALVAEIPLRSTPTLATRLGTIPELIMVLGALAGPRCCERVRGSCDRFARRCAIARLAGRSCAHRRGAPRSAGAGRWTDRGCRPSRSARRR